MESMLLALALNDRFLSELQLQCMHSALVFHAVSRGFESDGEMATA